MSYIMFGNLPASVPKVFDTTPCMAQQDAYEACISESGMKHMEIVHPNWPTMWPRLLTDGVLYDWDPESAPEGLTVAKPFFAPITKKTKQFLWECEYERFVFKACLRKVIGLKRTARHTSWNTAEVANIQFT